MTRAIKIATMLAIYLMWICGNTAIALACHANQEQHMHCCKSCECHHEGCDKSHFEQPHGCHHDHSNTILLYDSTKRGNINIEPAIISITAQIDDNIRIENIATTRNLRYYEHKVPIPKSPTVAIYSRRGPPVIA